jgi:hypothetical protein
VEIPIRCDTSAFLSELLSEQTGGGESWTSFDRLHLVCRAAFSIDFISAELAFSESTSYLAGKTLGEFDLERRKIDLEEIPNNDRECRQRKILTKMF